MKPTDHDPASHTLSNRVTELRKKRKLTLDQLATTSGVSRSMLSQIERGQANPTLTVTFRIAQAFGMSIGELVDQPWASSTIEVVHGEDKSNLFRSDKAIQIRTLSPLHIEKNIEFYELRIQPGASITVLPTLMAPKNCSLSPAAQLRLIRGTITVSSARETLHITVGI